MFVPAAASGLPVASDDERQPQRPQDETEHRADVSRDERGREG